MIEGLDAVGQAEAVRRGDISARELVEGAIARCEVANEHLNFVVTPLYEEALTEADRVSPTQPLAGVPIVLKDFLATCKGVRHAEGSRFLEDHVAGEDSEYVHRLRSAGAVIIGTATTPEMAILSTCEATASGQTRNPWDITRTTGGSSGGSAAAVAANVVPAAHGNDFGGSLRIPASCCGLVGLKPTRGRNPPNPELGAASADLWVEHVLTHTARDSAAFLCATSRRASGNAQDVLATNTSYVNECQTEPRPLRIAVSFEGLNGAQVAPACRAATEQAAQVLDALGHTVAEGRPPFDERAAAGQFWDLLCQDVAARIEFWSAQLGRRPAAGDLEPLTAAVAERGRHRTPAEESEGFESLQGDLGRIAKFFETTDLWLTPTLAQPPVALGHFDVEGDEQPIDALRRDAEFSPNTFLANLTGQPALSYPLRWDDGLPIGVQFVARPGHDKTLLQLAAQLERHLPPRRLTAPRN